MLTFEEFFTKKKIDLVQLQQAEPELFAEFKKDFAPMGEKSFDHSKKFWFNKLRRTYHLKEEPKPAKTEIELTEIASQAEPLDSPTIEQKPAYTPRFKASPAAAPSQDAPAANADTAAEKPKPAYTSRFKPAATVARTNEAPVVSPDPISDEKSKPALTPGFKMQTVVKKQEDALQATDSTATEKPVENPAAYKPRFNAKTVSPKKPEGNIPEAPAPSAEEKPGAYKPRFNIKNIKPKPEE